jgi:leader peptidase (prepilin peptidase)/N-methyltransferase
MELITGLLFAICFYKFGFTLDLLLALVFISGLIIIIISDFKYMIIPDEIIIVMIFALIGIKLFMGDINSVFLAIANGVIAFGIMFIIKKLGDKIFKKESLGGGDVKLMFILGFVLGGELSIIMLFLASLMAFPVAIFLLLKNKTNILPFGPFLSISAIVLFLLGITFNDILIFLFL